MKLEINNLMEEENLNKSINDLEGAKSSKRPNFNSYAVQESYNLMDKKLKFFEPQDLRLMIGQNLGLKYLVPRAINVLKNDPLIEAQFFEGDLLLKVLNIDKRYWIDFPEWKEELIKLFKNSSINYDKLDDDDTKWEIYTAYENLTDDTK